MILCEIYSLAYQIDDQTTENRIEIFSLTSGSRLWKDIVTE